MHYFDEDRVQKISEFVDELEMQIGSIISDFENSSATDAEWDKCESDNKKVQLLLTQIKESLYPSVSYVLDVEKEI